MAQERGEALAPWGGAPVIAAPSALRRRPIAGGRVLVIGAEERVAAIVQALAEDGLALMSAADRCAALMLVSETAPDLVIIDQDLPEGDGAAFPKSLDAPGVLTWRLSSMWPFPHW